jgi:phage tail sheath protein FI
MAEILLSPGVLARENDQSQITSLPIQAGAALVGPTVKGKVGIPRLITTYSEYQAYFGTTFNSGSVTDAQTYTYFTSISAYNYFQNGGTSLIVTRVASGSYIPALSQPISSSANIGSLNAFTLETLSDGVIMNSVGPEDAQGVLASGSKDNLRWEIVSPNTASGTFGLLIRRGDDRTNNKTVLETWTNLSLDPNSSNYVARIIGDQTLTTRNAGTSDIYLQPSGSYRNSSRYVRVNNVSLTTVDYLDSNGNVRINAYTSSIPIAQSGAFENATGNIGGNNKYYQDITNTNSQGLVGTNYTDVFNLLANKDEYRYNIISAPGLIDAFAGHSTVLSTLISNIENRGDAIAPIDLVGYGSSIGAVTSQAASRDTSYAAAYWPWLQTTDPDSGKNVFVPASTMIPGVYANNDRIAEAWFAPAGINRGGLGQVIQAERKLINADRDTLYQGKVNPIATFPNTGVVVFGQKTLQKQASALDRVNVRRLLIELKGYISQVADNLVFEQNTTATRNQFLAQVNPYLESVQQRQGLYAFRVVMDDSNNTPDVIDRNELRGGIYLQPTKTAEFIYLDFNILPTGVTFA